MGTFLGRLGTPCPGGGKCAAVGVEAGPSGHVFWVDVWKWPLLAMPQIGSISFNVI